MPTYESPLGTQRFGGVGMKEYSVPDESELGNYQGGIDNVALNEFQERLNASNGGSFDGTELSKAEYEIKAARESRRTGKERLNEGAKRRIEMLIGMTRLSRSVELDGNMYILQTLRSKEMRESFMAATPFDGTIQFSYEIRRQLIGRSLSQIAGVDVDQFLGSNTLESRFAFVDELPESLLGRLFDEYQLLVKDATQKYSIKTNVEAQEVLEDIKKA